MLTIKWESKSALVDGTCLVFGFNDPASLFQGHYYVNTYAPGNKFVYDHNLAIYGVGDVDLNTFSASVKPLRKGSADDGTLRDVYPIINAPALPFRAGLTLHAAKGTWSSLPHEFEAREVLDSRPMAFYESFAFVTEQPGKGGVVKRNGFLFDNQGNPEKVNDILNVRDRDIVSIPLGAHPVSGDPGVRIGYWWLYESNPDWVLNLREKF